MFGIGKATIRPVFEIDAGAVISECIPSATPGAIKQIGWLRPNYVDEKGKFKAQVQAFLVEVNGKKIVVDSCCGDGRERSDLPEWGNLHTGFLGRFKQVWRPEEVDFVINTHMHFDHVGWNVTQVDGKWMPTFPNAQYIFSKTEFDYWSGDPKKELADDRKGFKECVLPVHEAGLAKLVPDFYKVCAGVSLIPTPGHTPGHVCVLVESEGQQAVIIGDLMHHPCQIAHPEWGTPYDTDTEQANKSRRELLERFADSDALLVGGHFAEPAGGRLKTAGGGYVLLPLGG